MYYMFAMALVLDLGVIKLIFGDSSAFQLLRLVTFVGVPIVMSWRLYLQVVAQRAARGPIEPPLAGPPPPAPPMPADDTNPGAP